MLKDTRYLSRAGLAAFGRWLVSLGVWELIAAEVRIQQKTINYTPTEKLLDVFANIVAGGQGVCEINTRVRPEAGLVAAFGRAECAEQSTASRTLNACTADNVRQLRDCITQVLQCYGQAYHHDYQQGPLLLDIDMTGDPGGKQGEQVTKGYFGRSRTRRGRQIGRVYASQYREVLYDQLYAGTVQLDQSLQELVLAGLAVLELTPSSKKPVIIRVDGGGGRDADINWLLNQGYGVLTKTHNWQRANKLAKSVTHWWTDPKVPERQFGCPQQPHAYDRDTWQLVQRTQNQQGKHSYRVLVTNLDADRLFDLAGLPRSAAPTHQQSMNALAYAYDRRGGAAETSIRNSKQALQITGRYKRRFAAQQMLLLLAQLAYNLLTWFSNLLVEHLSFWVRHGFVRLIRDVFAIAGQITFDPQHQHWELAFNQAHPLAKPFLTAFQHFKPNDLSLILRKI